MKNETTELPPKMYDESKILISLQCSGPWFWTASVESDEFGSDSLQSTQTRSPAEALRELADVLERYSQQQVFYYSNRKLSDNYSG